jgi:HEPN domain-containing protein
VPRASRTRAVSAAHVRGYIAKAEEYLAGATTELEANRPIAATSLAIHAAINAADAVTGHRIGRRAAGQDHAEVRRLLSEAGKDGAEVDKDLARLLPLKAKAEYEPDEVPLSEARRAVSRAQRCVAVARRVVPAE